MRTSTGNTIFVGFIAFFAGAIFEAVIATGDTSPSPVGVERIAFESNKHSPQPKAEPVAHLAIVHQPTDTTARRALASEPTEEKQSDRGIVHVCLSSPKVVELESANKRLAKELARIQLRADSVIFPDETPHGLAVGFMRDAGIVDHETRMWVADWIDRFPVLLSRSELIWLVTRIELDDWEVFGEDDELALIEYLGAERVASELSFDRLSELQDWYADEGIFD